jgi:hypothetical protein
MGCLVKRLDNTCINQYCTTEVLLHLYGAIKDYFLCAASMEDPSLHLNFWNQSWVVVGIDSDDGDEGLGRDDDVALRGVAARVVALLEI